METEDILMNTVLKKGIMEVRDMESKTKIIDEIIPKIDL
jgi:hypothetical protein